MNIYKYFKTPTELDGYANRSTKIPQFAYEYAKGTYASFPEGENAIAIDPKYAYWYARFVLKGERFPEGEKTIDTDPKYAYWYATRIIKGRFPEGEKSIMTDPWCKEQYKELLDSL